MSISSISNNKDKDIKTNNTHTTNISCQICLDVKKVACLTCRNTINNNKSTIGSIGYCVNKYGKNILCPGCNGHCIVNCPNCVECSTCRGVGKINCSKCLYSTNIINKKYCEFCDGYSVVCKDCKY